MSERKWLIRKKGPVIELVGPVPKSELQRLIDERYLSDDDEVCSSNGFWFDLSESELVDKYIKGDELQPFNPISDAPTVLAREMTNGETHHHSKEISDITLVGMDMNDYYHSKSLNKEGSGAKHEASPAKPRRKGSDESPVFPSQNDLEYPDAYASVLASLRPKPKRAPEKVTFWKKLFSKKP